MRTVLKPTILAVSIITAFASSQAMATNGLAPTGLGQTHKAMGGAAAGTPINTMSMASNPASASFIPNGWDVGAEIFKPNRYAISNVPAAIPNPGGLPNPSGTEFDGNGVSAFLIPEFGYKKALSAQTAVGITVYGNGGMNTSFKPNSPVFPTGAPAPQAFAPFNGGAGTTTGIDLKQVFISPTVSRKLSPNHSIGLSVNLVAQQFKASGIEAFAGDPRANPQDLQAFGNPGSDTSTGIGATIGWMGKVAPNVTAGASYRMKTNMSEFDKYSGLFPEQGTMDIPAAATIGLSVNATPNTMLAADLMRIYYTDVAAIGNSGSSPNALGSDNGPGFGWDDQDIIKLGIKHQRSSRLALMAGYNHGGSPVGAEDTFFNALAPAVVEDHLSLGVEYKLSSRSKLIGSYVHTFENTIRGDLAQRQPFDLKMDQDALGIGYSVQY